MKGNVANGMLKTKTMLVLTLLTAVFLTACGSSVTNVETKNVAKAEAQVQTPVKAKKILVVYYSRSGNTRGLANQIQKHMGADIFEIETVNPYPQDYRETTRQAKQEIEAGYKPPLKAKVDNIKSYDVIFIGSPNWWATIAPPVATFLSEHDVSGKTIVPFMTHEGSGLGRSVSDIAKLCPQSSVQDGFALWGKDVSTSQERVTKWLRDLKL